MIDDVTVCLSLECLDPVDSMPEDQISNTKGAFAHNF